MIPLYEIVVLNALYLLCSILFDKWILQYNSYKTYNMSREHGIAEVFHIIWNCLYVTIMYCVLWKFIIGEVSNMAYLCSWFLFLQIAFYTAVLVTTVLYLDRCRTFITVLVFPALQSTAWVIFIVCVGTGSNVMKEFSDAGYFTVHVLPALTVLLHEVCSAGDISYLQRRSSRLRVGLMCSPMILLTLYAINIDPSAVYEKEIRHYIATITCFIASGRIFVLPLSLPFS